MKKLFGLAMVCCVIACGSDKPAANPSAPPGDNPDRFLKAPGDAKMGETTRCPVTGEQFVVNAGSPHTEYKGSTFYFCCSGCKKKFEANPVKYTEPEPPKPSAARAPLTIW